MIMYVRISSLRIFKSLTLNRTSFITVLSSFPEYQESVIKWGDERRKNIPINTRLSMYKLYDEDEESSSEDDSSSDENDDTKKQKVGLNVDKELNGGIEQKTNSNNLYIDTSGDHSASTIPNQIAKLENIAATLSRLILVQSSNESNFNVSNDVQSSINKNDNKVLSLLQPSKMVMQQAHPTPPKMLPLSNGIRNIGVRANTDISNAPPYKSMDSNPRFGGGYSIAENDDDDEYTIS